MKRFSLSSLLAILFLTILLAACSRVASTPQEASQAATATPAPVGTPAVSFVENATEPFDTFDGVAFIRHTGFFEGETSLGAFRVPYEIIAPEDPNSGNGTVLVEPPHFLGGPLGRDRVLFRDFVFQTVSGYASVGFGENARSILDPSASGLLLAGEPLEDPGSINLPGIVDEEIFIHFTRALTTAPYAVDVLGEVERLYGYGISQTAAVLLESQRNLARTSQQGLFDFTLLHTALWRAPFPGESAFDFLSEEFEPLQGVGKVIIVESEGDLVMSEAEQFRRVAGQPNYRLYEVAGAAHAPNANNPLDHEDVAQAMFAAGDRWVRSGSAPPPTILMETAAAGQVDPVYDAETGIARDGDLNARGGLRLPDLALGRAQFIASDATTPYPQLPPEFNILSGSMVNLACRPEPGSDSDEPRFSSHREYVSAFTRQVNELQRQGFLLESDAEALIEEATESDLGRPGTCQE